MQKYKSLNEDVLDDEKHPELLSKAQALQNTLMELLEKFKRLAKQRGIKYDYSTKESVKKQRELADQMSRNRQSSMDGAGSSQFLSQVGGTYQKSSSNGELNTIDQPTADPQVVLESLGDELLTTEERRLKDETPLDNEELTEDSDDPEVAAGYKSQLLEWVTD